MQQERSDFSKKRNLQEVSKHIFEQKNVEGHKTLVYLNCWNKKESHQELYIQENCPAKVREKKPCQIIKLTEFIALELPASKGSSFGQNERILDSNTNPYEGRGISDLGKL